MTLEVFAQQSCAWHRHCGFRQGAQDAVFAFDQMRRRQQLAGRLFSQHEFPGRRLDQVSRIGLSALKLAQLRRRGKILEMLLQVIPQRCFVEAVLWQNLYEGDIGCR